MGTHLRVLRELNTEYQHDSVQMVFKKVCVLGLSTHDGANANCRKNIVKSRNFFFDSEKVEHFCCRFQEK